MAETSSTPGANAFPILDTGINQDSCQVDSTRYWVVH